MSESRTLVELSDTDLDHVSGGITGLGFFVLVEGGYYVIRDRNGLGLAYLLRKRSRSAISNQDA